MAESKQFGFDWRTMPEDKEMIDRWGQLVTAGELGLLSEDPHREHEYLDPVPTAPPVGYEPPGMSIMDQVRQMVRSENLRAHALAEGFDTFEEEQDFEIADDEDIDPTSEWEGVDLPPELQEPPPSGQPAPSSSAGGEGGGTPTSEGAEAPEAS